VLRGARAQTRRGRGAVCWSACRFLGVVYRSLCIEYQSKVLRGPRAQGRKHENVLHTGLFVLHTGLLGSDFGLFVYIRLFDLHRSLHVVYGSIVLRGTRVRARKGAAYRSLCVEYRSLLVRF